MFGAMLQMVIIPNVTTGHIGDHLNLHDWFNGTGNIAVITDADYGAVDGGSAASNTSAINAAAADIIASGVPGKVIIPPGMDFPVTPDAVMGGSNVTFTGGGTLSTVQTSLGALITFPPGSEDFGVVGIRGVGGSDLICLVYTPSDAGNVSKRGTIKDNECVECTLVLTNEHDEGSALTYADRDTDPTTGNVTRNIDVVNNRGVRTAANLGSRAFILLWYTIGGKVHGNTADGYGYGIQWWGGDANPITADGDLANERKCGGFSIMGNEMRNLEDVLGGGAGIWGSMGKDITVNGANIVDNCADVGIDFEGCDTWICSGNIVTNCVNGCLTTFFYSRAGEFGPNTCRQDDAATHEIIARVQNQYAITDNEGVTFTGGNYSCRLGVARIALETADRTILKGVRGLNVRVDSEVNNQRHVEVDGCNLLFTEELPVALDPESIMVQKPAINVGRNHIGGRAIITGNTIETTIAQPAGARAIRSFQDDPTHDVLEVIDDNICVGWDDSIETIWNGANGGFTARTFLRRNIIDVGSTILNTTGPDAVLPATIINGEGNYYADGSLVP
jgi:hypothetical protein